MKNCNDVRALGIDANCCASCHCDDGYGYGDYGSELMTEQFRGETYLLGERSDDARRYDHTGGGVKVAENQEYDPVTRHSEKVHHLSGAELEEIMAEEWSRGWGRGYDQGYDDALA